MNFWSSERRAKLAYIIPSRDKSHGTELHKDERKDGALSHNRYDTN